MAAAADRPRGSGDATRARAQARSSARLAAVQGLYQMDVAGTGVEAVIAERLEYEFVLDDQGDAQGGALPVSDTPGDSGMRAPDATYMAEILRGVMRRQRDIDQAIEQQLATGWRLVRVDSTLRAILRAGVYELMERPDVPARVVISEHLRIADAFFVGDEPKVVNGVLDNLARKYRAGEFEERPS